MRKAILLMAIIVASAPCSFGQGRGDSITAKKNFGAYQFFQNKKVLKMGQLVKMMKPDEAAYRHMRSAQTNKTLSDIIGGIGGLMFGFTLGTAVTGSDANWTVGGIGVGLIAVSVPFTIKSSKESKRAVDIYNESRRTGAASRKTELHLGFTGSAIGLRLSF